jgi:hypothetical protein
MITPSEAANPTRRIIEASCPFVPAVALIDELTMRGMTVRLDMLRTHYRKPKNFTADSLNDSARMLRRWYARMRHAGAPPPADVVAALSDDLNTSLAITLLGQMDRDRPGDLYAGLDLLGLVHPAIAMVVVSGRAIPLANIPIVAWNWTTRPTA